MTYGFVVLYWLISQEAFGAHDPVPFATYGACIEAKYHAAYDAICQPTGAKP